MEAVKSQGSEVATPPGAVCTSRSRRENKEAAFEAYKTKRGIQRYRFWSNGSILIYATDNNYNPNTGCCHMYFEIKTVEALNKRTKIPTKVIVRAPLGSGKEERYDSWEAFVEYNLIIKLAGL